MTEPEAEGEEGEEEEEEDLVDPQVVLEEGKIACFVLYEKIVDLLTFFRSIGHLR